jgi:hypothetical protein
LRLGRRGCSQSGQKRKRCRRNPGEQGAAHLRAIRSLAAKISWQITADMSQLDANTLQPVAPQTQFLESKMQLLVAARV